MKYGIAISLFAASLIISGYSYPVGAIAILALAPIVVAIVLLIQKSETDRSFVIQIFLIALLLRIGVAFVINSFELQVFFGEDAVAHEYHGYLLFDSWVSHTALPQYFSDWKRAWGFNYLIASVYLVTGRNPLLIQFISSLAGAGSAVLIYYVTIRIIGNFRTARVAAVLTAMSPAMVIWSSQILKDGFVVFFLVLTIFFLARLQDKFSFPDLFMLLVSLIGVFSFRFYIFYFAAIACICSFVFGGERIVANNVRWFVILTIFLIIGAYAGVLSAGREQIESMSDLDRIQLSREVLARDAASGFGGEADIRTTSGILTAFPIGFAYLMLAPFPWQFNSLRGSLPFPEMVVWWILIPFMISGFKYTLRHRFRRAISVLVFSITLIVAYSLFQTNVGTAYRQRTQVQVFLFMFIGVGWSLHQERLENREMTKKRPKRTFLMNDN